jgi:molybdopterin-biosynthesis enzyme MoeA-like protein
LVSFKTLTQRLKSQGFELVETEMFGDAAKRLQEDPEMKEMINAMDPVVPIL